MSENIENLKSVLKIQILANTTQTTLSRNDIKKSSSALHFEKFGKVQKSDKNAFFIREIAANFNSFQGSSTSAQKLLLT